jgi:hypothetical protein
LPLESAVVVPLPSLNLHSPKSPAITFTVALACNEPEVAATVAVVALAGAV